MSLRLYVFSSIWFNYAPIKRLKDNKYLYMLKKTTHC
jgi:hypothetical protein